MCGMNIIMLHDLSRRLTVRRLAVVSILLLFGGGATVGAPYGEDYDYVCKVNVGPDNYLMVTVCKNGTVNFSDTQRGNCSNGWYARSAFPLSDERTQAWERIALASLMGHTSVHATTDGCTADLRLKLVQLQIQRLP
jgi:hypothetical protein